MAVRNGAFGEVTPTWQDYWSWRLALVCALVLLAWSLRGHNWNVVIEAGPFLAHSLGVSVLLTVASVGLGLPLGIVLATMRIGRSTALRRVSTAIIEVIRATPQLMVIFWVFFAVPALTGANVPAWIAAVVSLTLIAAAYLAEVVRAGLLSVPGIQIETGLTTGLSRFQILINVVLPQALRNMTPALIATIVLMFKITSLIYIVGITDFFRAVILVNNREFEPVVLYITMAGVYFCCCFILSSLIRRIDNSDSITY